MKWNLNVFVNHRENAVCVCVREKEGEGEKENDSEEERRRAREAVRRAEGKRETGGVCVRALS